MRRRYGIDTSRTGIWGGSAGGHLTALTAYSCGDTSFDAASAPAGSECAQAVVTWYGVFDFGPMLKRAAANPSTQRPRKHAAALQA
jgi:acetyl esterase/lipase